MTDSTSKKRLPILIIPGIMSSGLEVVKSRNGNSFEGQRVWMNPTAIGFGAMYMGSAEETVLNENNPKNLIKGKNGRFHSMTSFAFEGDGESDDDEEECAPIKGVSANDVKEGTKCKSTWLDHLSLSNDMVNERPGNVIRPIAGLDGVDFLTDMATIKIGASYVFGPIIKLLTDKGYIREKDLDAAPYDWRVPPSILEERDGYFTKTLDRIEKMYADSDETPVVLLCHSMGCKCGHYLLNFAKKHRGQDWLDKYIHSYFPVGGPHAGAPSTISMIFNPQLNPMLDPMLRNEERLVFGRSLGSGPWLMPRVLPLNVSAPPCLFCKEEGLLQISIEEPIGDCDTLIRTKYGTRDMDSIKLFVEFDDKIISSKAAPIIETKNDNKDAKCFAIKETFKFATPPKLTEGALPSFTLTLKHLGTMRAYDLEKTNVVFSGLRLIDRDRNTRKLINAGAVCANKYGTVIGRSTKQVIDINALSSASNYEMHVPVTIHARVDMRLTSLEPKRNSRNIQTNVKIKWIPPFSKIPKPSCHLAPVAVLDDNLPNPGTIQPISYSQSDYKPVSGNAIIQAEGLETTLNLIENEYERDDLGPRTFSATDAPPVKKVTAVYGINIPTQVSTVCCRRPISRSGSGSTVSTEFILDKSSCLAGLQRSGYVNDEGKIMETNETLQRDLLTGEDIHRSGDGSVPYYSLQQCQFWKKDGSCDVHIEEIDGAEHRAILADERFHSFLLDYVMV